MRNSPQPSLPSKRRLMGGLVAIGVLIAIVETTGGAPAIVHGLGLALLVARLMHGIALSSLTLRPVFRTGGMVLTFAVVAVAAISLLLERAIAAAT